MPEMYEIYEKHLSQYHELICAEDYQGNLWPALQKAIDWRNLAVIEGGVGTGRLTSLYIEQVASSVCCDRSQPMLDFAEKLHSGYKNKLRFVRANNEDLPALDGRFDLFIEGWSFGHSISDCANMGEVDSMTSLLVHNAAKNIVPSGLVIIVETLGTNVDSPTIPNKNLGRFYTALEQQHGFEATAIRTDYRFESNAEASRIMGFFFGETMSQSVLERKSQIIPEWTGIWTNAVS